MKISIIQEKSFLFSSLLIGIIYELDWKLFDPLLKQLFRSWTSIWANIEEAYWWQSKKDFIAKMFIALKESKETQYRLRLLLDSKHRELQSDKRKLLLVDCIELSKIITKIIQTAKSRISIPSNL